MKVGIITPRYPPTTTGGGEISVQLLAEQLALQTEHTPIIHSFDGNYRERINGIQVIRHHNVPSIPEIGSIIAVYDLRSEFKSYDILHGYNMELHPAVGLLSQITSTPSVAHLNSYTYIDKRKIDMKLAGREKIYNNNIRPFTSSITHQAISKIDRLIALSKSVRDIYKSFSQIDTDITLVNNMIDPTITPSSISYNQSNPVHILYVGSLNIHKGVEYLVKSMSYLDIEAKLSIVGDGPERNHIKNLVQESAQTDKINVIGRVPYEEVTEYYMGSDIFVHPGIWPEPLNRTIMEAMQYGLAVVSTNTGGPADIIEDGSLLALPADPKELARSIEYATSNRDEIGRRQRKYILNHHHPEQIIQDITDIYEEVI